MIEYIKNFFRTQKHDDSRKEEHLTLDTKAEISTDRLKSIQRNTERMLLLKNAIKDLFDSVPAYRIMNKDEAKRWDALEDELQKTMDAMRPQSRIPMIETMRPPIQPSLDIYKDMDLGEMDRERMLRLDIILLEKLIQKMKAVAIDYGDVEIDMKEWNLFPKRLMLVSDILDKYDHL